MPRRRASAWSSLLPGERGRALAEVAASAADDASLAAKSRAAVLELYSLDERLATAQAAPGTLQAAQSGCVAQRATPRRASSGSPGSTPGSRQNRLATRLRFIYEHGTTSSLDVVMGAKSLDDALTELDDFNRVAAVERRRPAAGAVVATAS